MVANDGIIHDAVTSQVWSGEADVNVAIVNWIRGEYLGVRVLQEQLGDRRDSEWKREEVAAITSALTSGVDVSQAKDIAVVVAKKVCFEGQQPGHVGFRFDAKERAAIAKKDPNISEVVFQYMIGNSLLSGSYLTDPEYIIDFGERSILEASAHPQALISKNSRLGRLEKERVRRARGKRVPLMRRSTQRS